MAANQIRAVIVLVSVSAAMGCAGIEQQILTWMPPPSLVDREAVAMRVDYQQSGSTQAINWLLAHDVEQGMSPAEVSDVIGETGERIFDDGWITNDGGTYQVGDETYKWGPDSQGHSYFLVFRDRKLVNFNPAEFE